MSSLTYTPSKLTLLMRKLDKDIKTVSVVEAALAARSNQRMSTRAHMYRDLAVLIQDMASLYKGKQQMLDMCIKLVTDGIHQCPAIHTGKISEKAVERREEILGSGGKWVPTKEHFRSRKDSARYLFDLVQRRPNISLERLEALIKSRCRVHYTTKEENMELRRHSHLTHWHQQYESAGVVLVDFQPKTNKYVYNIEGVEWTSVSELAKWYDITVSGVDYRVKADTYPTWTRKEI